MVTLTSHINGLSTHLITSQNVLSVRAHICQFRNIINTAYLKRFMTIIII